MRKALFIGNKDQLQNETVLQLFIYQEKHGQSMESIWCVYVNNAEQAWSAYDEQCVNNEGQAWNEIIGHEVIGMRQGW